VGVAHLLAAETHHGALEFKDFVILADPVN
jgi:hypothetical protein